MLELTKQSFQASDLAAVQNFHCGGQHYEVEVSDWIKGDGQPGVDCALTSIADSDSPSRVWLYTLSGESLLGYAALAKRDWRWKGKKDPHIPVTVIIWVGLDSAYQGKPDGPKEDRYCMKVMGDLISEALKDRSTHPVLGLLVHKDNAKAIALYKRFNFDDGLVPILNRISKEVEYLRMFLILDAGSLLAITSAQKRK